MCPHLSHDLISAAPTNKSSGTRVNYRVPNWCSSSSTKTATAMWKGRDEICCHHFFQRERDVHQMRWWNWDWNTPLSWNSSRSQASHGCHLTYTKILRSEKLPQSVALCKLFSETLRKEVLKEAIILHVFTMPSSHCMPPLRTNLVALLIWKFPPSFHPPSLSPAVIRRKQMIPGNNLLINQIQELLSAT